MKGIEVKKYLLAGLYCGVPALGWAADGPQLEEIVVTAQKRTESLQTIPLSVQAVSGDNIEDRSMRSVDDLIRFVPSVSVAPETGIGDRNIVIRGVAPSGGTLPAVVTYLGDTLIPNSIDPLLYDVSRVEVLKGPQGDLYGASAAGGLIRYVEQRPDTSEFGGRFEVQGSSTERGGENFGGAGVVNIPIADDLAVRASVVYDNRDGYIDNIDPYTGARKKNVNDVERVTARLAGLWTPSDTLEIAASTMFNKRENGGFSESDRNDRLPSGSADSFVTSRFFPENSTDEAWVSNLTINLDVGIGSVTSATGYVSQDVDNRLDVRDIYNLDPDLYGGFSYPGFDPGVNGPFVGNPNTLLLSPFDTSKSFKQFTQEVRFASSWGFPVQVLVGGFYLDSETDLYQRLGFDAPIPEFGEFFGGNPDSLIDAGFTGKESVKELSGFGNLQWEFADGRGEVTAGVRYYDRSNPRKIVDSEGALFPNAIDVTAKKSGKLFSASASYEFTPTLFGFARYAEGFRPGVGRILPGSACNADFVALGVNPSDIPAFTSPENLKSYEVGVRKTTEDRRYSIGLSGYVIKYEDIQQSLVLPTCAAIFDVNAGSATSKGAEMELALAPTDDLSFMINVGYTDSRLDDSDPFSGGDKGEKLQYVPTWTFSIQQNYETEISESLNLVIRSDLSYIDSKETEFGLTGERPDPATSLAGYTLVNAQMGVSAESWEAVLFVDNLTDELPVYGTNALRYFGSGGRTWSVGAPRTWGVRLRRSF